MKLAVAMAGGLNDLENVLHNGGARRRSAPGGNDLRVLTDRPGEHQAPRAFPLQPVVRLTGFSVRR